MSDRIAEVRDFPRGVREIEHLWIPMPDGVRLAARLWLPRDAESDPVPALLEYLPYRKRDGTVTRDQLTHPYFAGHGYAGVRVDLRGTGDSEGVCRGEYLQQELDDGVAVIAWLAAQPWCTGRVGMFGISWGGFNALQIAALRPPALEAVVTICSTDDRYSDDIHYLGGAQMTENLSWGATALAIAMAPPDPAIVGERWREMWLERANGNGLWVEDWFRHQRRDAFYRHGSIAEDWSAITIPVYAVGGWVDGYTNAIFRLLEHLDCPRKGLIGPWGHKYPHFALPGPQIGFLQECLRWWDQHLKGVDTGIMTEPMLRAWLQEPARPDPVPRPRPGRWIAEPLWPAEGERSMTLALSRGRLGTDPSPGERLSIRSPQTTGLSTGTWCSFTDAPMLPLDQRLEDGGSLVFLGEPLEEALAVFGFPELTVRVSSDRPVATLVAVLSAVDPDGAATKICHGVLNLTHRDGHADPRAMTPGQAETIRLRLDACGQSFARGQRVRLALSTTCWPLIFPAPHAATLTVDTGGSRLSLPVRDAPASDAELRAFDPAEGAPPLQTTEVRPGSFRRTLVTDQVSGESVFERRTDGGAETHHPTGLTVDVVNVDRFVIRADEPLGARGDCHWSRTYSRDGWRASVGVDVAVEARAEHWHLEAEWRLEDADGPVAEKRWSADIPRDLV